MIPVAELRNRDKALYWNGTVVFDKVKGKAYHLRELADEAHVCPVGSSRVSRVIPLEEFSKNFLANRLALGWINCDVACMYAWSSPGRGNRKAYTFQDVRCISPVYDDAALMYRQIKRAALAEDPYLDNGIPDTMRAVQDSLSALSSLKPNSINYFKEYGQEHYKLDDAISLMQAGKRLGCALDLSWALLSTAEDGEDECSVMYHDARAGTYHFEKGFIVDEGKEELETAWSRL